MNANRLIAALLAPLMLAGSSLGAPAAVPRTDAPEAALPFANVSADCYSVGLQIATREGGTLYNAQADTRGGRPVCVIVVVIPQPEGQRRLRAEFVVPR